MTEVVSTLRQVIAEGGAGCEPGGRLEAMLNEGLAEEVLLFAAMRAVENDQFPALRLVLQHAPTHFDWLRVGHAACRYGRLEQLVLLRANGFNVNARIPPTPVPAILWTNTSAGGGVDSDTPLHTACRGKADHAVVAWLLAHGADASAPDQNGFNPLERLRIWCADFHADPAVTALLCNAGGSADELFFDMLRATTPEAFWAVVRRGGDAVGSGSRGGVLLDRHLNSARNGSRTCNLKMVSVLLARLLLRAGADPNETGPFRNGWIRGTDWFKTSMTPLTAARVSQRRPLAILLEQYGGRVSAPDPMWRIEPGVTWPQMNEFLVAKGSPREVAAALTDVLSRSSRPATCYVDARGRTFRTGATSYVVTRPTGMAWTNLFRVTIEGRPENCKPLRLAPRLADALAAPTIWADYDDTPMQAEYARFGPPGGVSTTEFHAVRATDDAAWLLRNGRAVPAKLQAQVDAFGLDVQHPQTTMHKLEEVAIQERFALGWWDFFIVRPRGLYEVEFDGLMHRAIDETYFVTT